MRSGRAPGEVGSPDARVLVNGVWREAASVEVSRELKGLPGMSGGMVAATGTVEWGTQPDVQDGLEVSGWFPVDGWPPSNGENVGVWMGDGVERFRHLNGVIESTTGKPGQMSSELVDYYDRFTESFSFDPLLASMPPLRAGDPVRNVGLYATSYVNAVARACQYWTTPINHSQYAGLSVPFHGTAWPEQGTVTAASGSTWAPTFRSTANGVGVVDGSFEYRTDGDLRLSDGVEVNFTYRRDDASTYATVYLYFGASRVRIRLYGMANVGSDANWTEVSQSYQDGREYRFQFTIKNNTVTISDDGGNTTTGTISGLADLSQPISRIVVDTNGPNVSGLQVKPLIGKYLTDPINAQIDPFTDVHPALHAGPAITSRTGADLLNEIAESTGSVWWLNEDGQFRWKPLRALMDLSRNPVAVTLSSEDSLLDLGWETPFGSAASKVRINSRQPGVTRSLTDTITLWQSSGGNPGEKMAVEIINVPADEDWIMLDWDMERVGTDTYPNFNVGRGSFYGGMTEDGKFFTLPEQLSATVEKITGSTYKLTTVTDSDSYKQEVPDSVDIRTSLHGFRLPVLRGRGKVTWADQSTVSGVLGPAGLPAHEHEAGPWVQMPYALTALADRLASIYTSRSPATVSVPVVPDSRLQLGDMVRLVDSDVYGVTITGVIAGVDYSISDGDESMSVTVWIVGVEKNSLTYSELDAATVGEAYGALDQRLAAQGTTYGNAIEGIMN